MRLIPILLLLFFYGCTNGNPGDGRESNGDKREWSFLQELEYMHRAESNLTFEIFTKEEYSFVQIPNLKGKGAIYIMLNPSHAPLYKQMPNIPFDLTKSQYESIKKSYKTTSTVIEALRSHVNSD